MTNCEAIFSRQEEIVTELQRIGNNFDKDSAHRKTSEYLKIRLDALDNFWGEFDGNNTILKTLPTKSQRYFQDSIYDRTIKYYHDTRAKIASYEPYMLEKPSGSGKGTGTNTETGSTNKVDKLLSQQRTNFRAFKRLVSGINVSEISEKWELEDELRSIQSRWDTIDKLHLEIDNILEGEDEIYQDEFIRQEISFKTVKKALNQKLSATSHIQKATPILEIPTFSGKYTFWPTFFDLFSESIHDNNYLSKAQKMQHLKGKLKGEAERLIQHLNISSDNYDIAWEILTHRYNNPQVLFTTHIETFLNQPSISKQTSFEIKRLYDTTTECIHAMHNLGVDTNSWDPILVHLIAKKLDSETYNSYKEARKSPRELPNLTELMAFLESKFMALEPIQKKEKDFSTSTKQASSYQAKPSYKHSQYNNKSSSKYQAAYTSTTSNCPLCHFDHELYRCQQFLNMPADTKLKTVTKLQLCKNCLFKHSSNKCVSIKRCKECNGEHHTQLHDTCAGSLHSKAIPNAERKPPLSTPTKPLSNKPHTASHVSANHEVLLATVLLKIKAIDGNYITLRALLDQGSQITLISDNAAQLLGLPRQKFNASVSGVGISSKQSKQFISLECKSIYEDYNFYTEACIIPRVISDLPHVTFSKQIWPHIQHINLADPEYNVSKPIDLLLDASVYSDIIMSGLVKGPPNAPIAQQTKIGWILSGNVKTFNCSIVVNNLDQIAKYWEMEEMPNASSELTKEEQYCEEHYIATTKRLEDGRYEVALPMKQNYKEKLGYSKAKATAQFIQLENKMSKNEAYSTSYKQFIHEYQLLGHMRPATQDERATYIMPHHGILKPESTTSSMRVVFNASSKTSSGFSLNDVMECGPNLQHDLPILILKWRLYKYVLTADIEKMFRQFLIREDDQHLQLAPLNKKGSLPRLELCGALLLAQLIQVIKASLENKTFDVYAWTDSTVVLGWLHGDLSRWKQFVANRVQQITEIIPSSNWNHVRSEDNAADCATRGLTVAKLQKTSLWWNGPEWLASFVPSNIKNKTYEPPTLEAKNLSVTSALHQPCLSFINELLINNSSITRTAKVVAWVSRFTAAVRHKRTEHASVLSVNEINKAYELITKHVQAIEFESDLESIKSKGHVRSNSQLANLCPYLDENGILRVGGRLSHSIVSSSAKHPAILSSHSRFTDLLINQAHITTLHGGPRLTLSYLREKYWILSGMRTVKKQLRTCTTCRRFSTEKQHQVMADLPRARVTPSRPFTHTGVDFTGHVDLKASKGRGVKTFKGYVAVFICLATKAVHLELVSDLSTQAFLAAFRRFCARRGTPRRMYSDNGTNFIGAKRALDSEYKQILATINQDLFNNLSDMNIEWCFNAPAWPSAGGLWEAAVKSFKRHLKRVLGEQKLTYEEFTTLLQQIEACLNSRPLFPLTENPEDSYLTPGHFLIGDSLLSRPQTDSDDVKLLARWQLVQSMNKNFWKLWSSDYLQHLQVRSKWRTPTKNLNINDIVLLKEDNLPPGKWALGRVVDLHPGSDGYVRVVSIKTENKILKRPVTKLVLLPIDTGKNDDSSAQQNQLTPPPASTDSKAQAKRRKTTKSYLTLALLLFTMMISPSTQQNVSDISITALNDSKTLYFDKLSNLQFIRDEWKLVVYYNLTGYWQSITDMEIYVRHLKGMTMKDSSQYQQIVNQLAHELTEIEHYNRLLQSSSSKRQKRGIVNGVGNLANYLFGVLDVNFAQQYAKDIEKMTYNENHLNKLIKNQTIVIEAEYNIIQRNEQVMNKQFSVINEHLRSISADINQVRSDADKGLYITSSALAASIILENLRRMQTSLIDTVTDIIHGRIDAHLITSEQLEEQINFISAQLQGDLKVPLETGSIRDIYKLLKVAAKVYKKYLIIEIKVPLVSNEIYELDKIISIPQNRDGISFLTVPTHPYLAFNLRKDAVLFLTDYDLLACLQASEEKILCNLDKPIYNLNLQQSICNITLINAGKLTSSCIYEHSPCVNRWVKLHGLNSWLYSCCNQCNIRTFCTADVTMNTLSGNGLLEIGQGCTIKGDLFTIHSHHNFLRKVNIQPSIEAPEVSILNSVIKTSGASYEFTTENHEQIYRQVMDEINSLKQQSTPDLSIHDVHQYSIIYGMLAVLVAIGVVAACVRARRRCMVLAASPGGEASVSAAASERARCAPTSTERYVSNECSELRESVSMVNLSVNRGIAPPKPPRAVSVPIPCESYGEVIGPTGGN